MYRLENKDIVISGWEKGISDDPYTGTADLRAVNTISVPGEASVNFATTAVSAPQLTGTATSADAGTNRITITGASGLTTEMAITFSASTMGGVSTGTTYYVTVINATTITLSTTLNGSTLDVTSDGTGTFASINMGLPKHMATWRNGSFFMLDDLGQCWVDPQWGSGTKPYWIYMNNSGGSGSKSGNGFVQYSDTKNNDYLFVFRDARVDYLKLNLGTMAWVYGWDLSTGGSGANFGFNFASSGENHTAFCGTDNVVYYCDRQYIGAFFQKAPGTAFDPTSTTSYTSNTTALRIPTYDKAQCIAELGTTLLIGGIKNAIYPWDRISTSFSYPILIAESFISKMLTINTTTYIFPGNRGRIYKTNGYQASLYKKVPDHLSDTVEPYFKWGGVASLKNQLYFGVKAFTNGGTAIPNYGGVWAIDTDTDALRCTAKLSYGTYAGYASAMIADIGDPSADDNTAGSGLIIGWVDGTTSTTKGGIDAGTADPYINGEAIVECELIPVGTYLTKRTFEQVEYKLSRPLVAGESVALYYKTSIGGSLTNIPITQGGSIGDVSGIGLVNFQNVQWIAIRAVLTSTATTPSFVRLREFRIR